MIGALKRELASVEVAAVYGADHFFDGGCEDLRVGFVRRDVDSAHGAMRKPGACGEQIDDFRRHHSLGASGVENDPLQIAFRLF